MLSFVFLLPLFTFSFATQTSHLYVADGIPIPFYLTEKNQPCVDVCFGTPKQCFKLKISTAITQTFVLASNGLNNRGYNEDLSKTAFFTNEHILFEYFSESLVGKIMMDRVEILKTNIDISKFTFIIITGGFNSTDYDGVLGLGRFQGSEYLSIVSSCFTHDLISKRAISIEYLGKKEGELTFGSDGNLKKKGRSTRAILSDSPMFRIVLKGILYHNENVDRSYIKEQKVVVSPGSNIIQTPTAFFIFIVSEVFSNALRVDGLCDYNVKENNNVFSVIECDPKILEHNLGYLYFFIEKWSIKLYINDLFEECDGGNVCFLLKANEVDEDWVFGYPILKKYKTIFNFDNSVVAFK